MGFLGFRGGFWRGKKRSTGDFLCWGFSLVAFLGLCGASWGRSWAHVGTFGWVMWGSTGSLREKHKPKRKRFVWGSCLGVSGSYVKPMLDRYWGIWGRSWAYAEGKRMVCWAHVGSTLGKIRGLNLDPFFVQVEWGSCWAALGYSGVWWAYVGSMLGHLMGLMGFHGGLWRGKKKPEVLFWCRFGGLDNAGHDRIIKILILRASLMFMYCFCWLGHKINLDAIPIPEDG